MPDQTQAVVINTTPLIALSVAAGSLDVLRVLYRRVVVPQEVRQEILAGGRLAPGVAELLASEWLECLSEPQALPLYLRNTLDRGEASVIQAALAHNITLVCIDEKVGRRIARLHGLTLTGSIGILAKARRAGFPLDIGKALASLHEHGIWLGKDVVQFLKEHN